MTDAAKIGTLTAVFAPDDRKKTAAAIRSASQIVR
jgi:hypothetical protein